MAAGGGIVRRIVQRQFDWAGSAWAMLVLGLGAAIGAGILQLPAATHAAARLPALAAAVLSGAAISSTKPASTSTAGSP